METKEREISIVNKTELQRSIINVIRGEKACEVIHAFEIIKLEILFGDDKE